VKFLSLKFGLLILGLVILFISTTRASLDLFKNEDRENEIRNNPLTFRMINKNGEVEQQTYKLTNAGLLPNSPFYGIKLIRDGIWLVLSQDQKKTRVALLLGDKRMIEAKNLLNIGNEKLAIKTANAAIDKLEYANYLNNNADEQLQKQIFLAGFAYREILKTRDKIEDVNNQNWIKLIQRINDWNKKMVEKI